MRTGHHGHHPRCACESDTLNASMKAELCWMVHEEDVRKVSSELAGLFLESHKTEIKALLGKVAKSSHLDYSAKGDLLVYFYEVLIFLVTEKWRQVPGQFNMMSQCEHILGLRTRELIRKYRLHGLIDGGSRLTGSAAYRKKMDLVAKSREAFAAEHYREPTDHELCTYHNALMHKNRANPRKSGVLISPADLVSGESISLDDENSPMQEISMGQATGDDGEEAAATLDRAATIREIISECDRLDQQSSEAAPAGGAVTYGRVARTFFAHHADNRYPTSADVKDALGVTSKSARREVSRRLSTVKEVAKEKFQHLRVA